MVKVLRDILRDTKNIHWILCFIDQITQDAFYDGCCDTVCFFHGDKIIVHLIVNNILKYLKYSWSSVCF